MHGADQLDFVSVTGRRRTTAGDSEQWRVFIGTVYPRGAAAIDAFRPYVVSTYVSTMRWNSRASSS